jgi:hypothetical protein
MTALSPLERRARRRIEMTKAAADMIAYLEYALTLVTCLCILLAGIIAALLWDRGAIGQRTGVPRLGRRSAGAHEQTGRARAAP